MKKSRIILAFAVAAILALSLFACTQTGGNTPAAGDDFTFVEFVVPESDTVGFGAEYEIPVVKAKGSDGDEYLAYAEVEHKGEKIALYGNRFMATDWEDYIVTFTVSKGDKSESKKMTVKVVDGTVPQLLVGQVSDYEVDSKFVLPRITVTDDLDKDITPVAYLRKKGGETVSEDPANYTFTEFGAYELVVTATDAAGNTAESTVAFNVRHKREPGEFECFNDDYTTFKGTLNHGDATENGLTREKVGGRVPEGDGYYAYTTFTGDGAHDSMFLCIHPRFSKEELKEWIDNKTYTALQVRFYIDCDQASPISRMNLYYYTGVSSNLLSNGGTLPMNTWLTYNFPAEIGEDGTLGFLTQMYDYYEDLMRADYFYFITFSFANDVPFTVYVDYVKLVDPATVTFKEDLPSTVTLGSTMTKADFGLAAADRNGAPIDPAEFTLKIRRGDEVTTVSDTDSYTFDDPGEYIVEATLNDDKYSGTAIAIIGAYNQLDAIKQEAAELAAEGNKDDSAFYTKLTQFHTHYAAMSPEDKAAYPVSEVIADIWADFEPTENKLWYYDTAYGIVQYLFGTASNATVADYAEIGEAVSFVTDGETKGLRFTTAEKVKYVALPISNVLGTLGELEEYAYLNFKLKAVSAAGDDSVRVAFTDGVSVTPSVKVPTGSWQDVHAAIAGTDFATGYILIYGGAGGSLPAQTELTISGSTLEYREFLFTAPGYTDRVFEVGDELAVDDKVIVLVRGNKAEASDITLAFVSPDGDVNEITGAETFTLDKPGEWTLKAKVEGSDYFDETFTFTVRSAREEGEFNAFGDEYSVAEFQANTHGGRAIPYGVTQDAIGGEKKANGGYYAYYDAGTEYTDHYISLKPRFTKSELHAWNEAGKFNAMQLRMYVEYEGEGLPVSAIQLYYLDGAAMQLLSFTEDNFTSGTWLTYTFYTDRNGGNAGGIPAFIEQNYDQLYNNKSDVWYFICIHSAADKPTYRVYLDYVKLVNAASVSFGADLEADCFEGATLTKAQLGLTAAKMDGGAIEAPEFNITVWHNGTVEPFGDSYTFEEAGTYTITAELASGSYAGSASKRIEVYGDGTYFVETDEFFDLEFEKGDEISFDDLEFTVTGKAGAVDRGEITLTFTDPDKDTRKVKAGESYTFGKTGYYTVSFTVGDGEPLEDTYEFLVRAARIDGEFEAFNDDFYHATASSKATDELDFGFVKEVGGESKTDGYYMYTNVTSRGMFLHVSPRFTKAELQRWKEEKTYNALQIRWYIEYKGEPLPATQRYFQSMSTLYNDGVGMPVTTLITGTHDKVTPNTWMTTTFYADYEGKNGGFLLDELLEKYDCLNKTDAWYFLTFSAASNQPDVKVYFDYIRLVNAAEVSFGAGANKTFYKGDSVTKADLGLTAAVCGGDAIEGAEFDVTVSYNGGEATKLTDSYTFAEAGSYTITATLTTKGYVGSESKTIAVDIASYTENKFDSSKWEKGHSIAAGTTVAWSDLDYKIVNGGGDVDAAKIEFTFTDPEENATTITSTGGSVTLDKVGVWTVKATVDDVELAAVYSFTVRSAVEEGMFNDFGDDYALYDADHPNGEYAAYNNGGNPLPGYGVTKDNVGDEAPTSGAYAWYDSSNVDGKTGHFVCIRPRFTKSELHAWNEAKKYNALQIRIYVDYDGEDVPLQAIALYVLSGSSLWLTDFGTDNYTSNTWLTYNLYRSGDTSVLDFFEKNYDDLWADSCWYALSINGNKTETPYRVYIDYVKFVDVADVSIEGLTEQVYVGDTVTKEQLGLSATEKGGEPVASPEYKVTVSHNGAETDFGASYIFNEAGSYTITATLTNAGYVASATKTIEVIEDTAKTFTAEGFTDFAFETGYTFNFDEVNFDVALRHGSEPKENVTLVFIDPKDASEHEISQEGTTSFTLDKPGEWTLKAKVGGEYATGSYTFKVRLAREDGEFECFNDEFGAASYKGNTKGGRPTGYGLTTEAVGGESKEYGGYAWYQSSTAYTDHYISLKPRFTKEELQAWSGANKYNALQVRMYVDYDGSDIPVSMIRLYVLNGAGMELLSFTPENYSNKTWLTYTFYTNKNGGNAGGIPAFIETNYDQLDTATNHSDVWYFIAIDSTSAMQSYRVYLDYVKLVNDTDVSFTGEIKESDWWVGDSLSASDLGVKVAGKDGGVLSDVTYDLTVTCDGKTVPFGDSYTFNQGGKYTITATVTKEGYSGSFSKTITVEKAKFDVTAGVEDFKYVTEDEVKWSDFTFTVTDKESSPVTDEHIKLVLVAPSGVEHEIDKTSVTSFALDEAGVWNLRAKVDDVYTASSYPFKVRMKCEDGELECFNDEFAGEGYKGSTHGGRVINNGFTAGEIGGEKKEHGGYAWFQSSTEYTDHYINLRPRFTEEELHAWNEAKKYNALQIRMYVDYAGSDIPVSDMLIYLLEDGTGGVWDSRYTLIDFTVDNYSNNTWITYTFYTDKNGGNAGGIPAFLEEHYEDFYRDPSAWYFIAINSTSAKPTYRVYVDYIKLVNADASSVQKG